MDNEEHSAKARGARLKALRKKKYLTQEYVSERVDGWERQNLSDYERGVRDLANAKFSTIIQLADALGVEVCYLAALM